MLIGIGLIVAGTLLWSALGPLVGMGPGPVAGVILAGAAGASVSVLSRMTTGKLMLAFDSGASMLRLLGAVRPFVGAAFACALFAVIASGLLPVTLPAESPARDYFFAAVAFLAGFSERWAQDMLGLGRKSLSAQGLDTEPVSADTRGSV